MCSNESPPPSKEPLTVGLGLGNPMTGFLPGLEHYRLQLYHYAMAERLRLAQQLHPQHPAVAHPTNGTPSPAHLGMTAGFPAPLPLYPAAGYPGRLALSMALLHPHHQRIPEEPKPQHSYIGLIAMAILSSPDKKLVLSDIYQHILEHYPYFRTRGPGWRNSIRHNLSLNDCFVKSGRSANGKGHYWAIHPANLDDFRRGDFARRKAQRKVRRHMGLAVEEEPDSPSPPPQPASTPPPPPPPLPLPPSLGPPVTSQAIAGMWTAHHHHHHHHPRHAHHPYQSQQTLQRSFQPSRKRLFDVASLLAPDDRHIDAGLRSVVVEARKFSCSEDEHELQEQEADQDEDADVDVDVDVVAEPNALPLSSSSSSPPPSTTPDAKVVSSAEHCDAWTNPSARSSVLSNVHLHSHLHVRNYYVPASNASSGAGV